MADEAKDLGGISKGGTDPKATPAPQSETAPEAEVRILEEHVTHAAAKPAAPAQSAPVAPKPNAVVPPVPNAPVVPKPSTSVPQSVPEAKPLTAIDPALALPVPTVVPAPKIRPAPVKQFDSIADDVGLVLPTPKTTAPKALSSPLPPPIPSTPERTERKAAQPSLGGPVPVAPLELRPNAPASPSFGGQSSGTPILGDDIAKILAEVKLPEKREPAVLKEKKGAGEQKKFDTSLAASAVDGKDTTTPASVEASPPVMPEPMSPNAPKEIEKNTSSVTPVHTLKNDLQSVVHDQKISLVRAVSLEEDRRAHTEDRSIDTAATAQRSRRTFGIIFAVVILLGLGGAAVFGVIFIMNQQKTSPQISSGSSILFAEQSVLLSLDTQSTPDLKRTLEGGRTTAQGALGSIVRIVPVRAETTSDGTIQNRPATFKEFAAAIGAHPPDDLLRALGDDFFLGIHAVDKSAPILIIPVMSHDNAFAAMLAWEGGLNADLAPLFTAVPILATDKDGLPVKRTYEDLVMRNYDVRALKDDAGTIQLYYSFPSQNILIIAESPYSFPEILSRLQASRQL